MREKTSTACTNEFLSNQQPRNQWSLFLDRDGVISESIMGVYVKDFKDFKFKKDFLDIFPKIAPLFGYIFVVTNQSGVGKGLMTLQELETVHNKMVNKINVLPGKIDKIYSCIHLKDENCLCRKPRPGMAYMAKNDFPHIDFEKAILIGDSDGDIGFGKSVGMKTILVNNDNRHTDADYSVKDFYEIEKIIKRLLK